MWNRKEGGATGLAILSKLGPNYSMFVSNFHATKLIAQAWKMPSLANFMESLTQEQVSRGAPRFQEELPEEEEQRRNE